jgi:protein SDA1
VCLLLRRPKYGFINLLLGHSTYDAQILTPADFALLNDLRKQAAAGPLEATDPCKRKLASFETIQARSETDSSKDAFVTEDDILGVRKKHKADYAERMATVQNGREGRGKFGSHRGKEKKDTPSSSTNKDKLKHKPMMMILSSNAVRRKKKASLREKQRKLRAHAERLKKGPR